MNKLIFKSFILLCFLLPQSVFAQLSGDYTLSTSFYDRDEDIGTGTTQYLREHSSAESWLFMNYRYQNFEFSLRHDLFHNSPLLDPDEAYTEQGIPFFSASADIEDLSITVGSFYDQFGSGLLFRAFEDRQIGLDYAMQGARLQYSLTDDLSIKAFTGQQKNRFSRFDQVVKGIELDHYYSTQINEESFSVRAKASGLNRTIDQSTMERIASEIESYPVEDRFPDPKYNVYGYSGYISARYRWFTLSTEYAGKTREAIRDENTERLVNSDGFGLRNRLGFTTAGLGINLRYKYTDRLTLRSHPFTAPEEGVLNYVPSFTRQHAYRLPARYGASNHEPGEQGLQLDATWTPARGNTFNFNVSGVNTLESDTLFQEVSLDYERRWNRAFSTTSGVQKLWYNQEVFENKPGAPLVDAWTVYTEYQYRINRQHSLRSELQYLYTDQDQGDFAFMLLEWNISPNYSFSVSDLINTRPAQDDDITHFYSVFASYRHRQTQFTLSYSKQPEGVVCTGGVCRVEPAFSGVRAGVSTNF